MRKDKSERVWQGQQQGSDALSSHLNKWQGVCWTLTLRGQGIPALSWGRDLHLAQVFVEAGNA